MITGVDSVAYLATNNTAWVLDESPGVAYNNESPGVVPEVANEEPTSTTGVENEDTPIDELFEPFDNTAGVDDYHSTTRLDDDHPTPIDEHNPTDTSAPIAGVWR